MPASGQGLALVLQPSQLSFDASKNEFQFKVGVQATTSDDLHPQPRGSITAQCAAFVKPHTRSLAGKASLFKHFYLEDPYVEGSAAVTAGVRVSSRKGDAPVGLVLSARKTLNLEDLEPYVEEPRRDKGAAHRPQLKLDAKAAVTLEPLALTAQPTASARVIYTKRSATDCQDVGIVAGFDWPQRAPAGGATAAAAAVAAALRRHLPAGPPPLNLIPALIMRLPAKLLGKGRRAAKGGATGRPKLQHEVSITNPTVGSSRAPSVSSSAAASVASAQPAPKKKLKKPKARPAESADEPGAADAATAAVDTAGGAVGDAVGAEAAGEAPRRLPAAKTGTSGGRKSRMAMADTAPARKVKPAGAAAAAAAAEEPAGPSLWERLVAKAKEIKAPHVPLPRPVGRALKVAGGGAKVGAIFALHAALRAAKASHGVFDAVRGDYHLELVSVAKRPAVLGGGAHGATRLRYKRGQLQLLHDF